MTCVMTMAQSVVSGDERVTSTHWVKAVCAALLATAMPAAPAVGAESDFHERLQAEWQRQLMDVAPTSGRGRAGGASTQSDAAGGCDGVKNGGFGFHTNQQAKPWWQVDLGAKARLDRVVVYNRCNTASERAARVHVMLGEDGKTWRTVYRHNGKTFLGLTDKKPLVVGVKGESARFVRIQLPDNIWLHLDEIEVYGADDPNKNIALNKPADQSSAGTWSTRKRVMGKAAKGPKAKAAVPQGPYVAAVQDLSLIHISEPTRPY